MFLLKILQVQEAQVPEKQQEKTDCLSGHVKLLHGGHAMLQNFLVSTGFVIDWV